MNKDEIVLASTTANGMREITQERANQAMQEQAVAFAEWVGEECSYAGSGFYIHISTLRQYKLPELYTLFNTNNTNNGE